ncbi:MAG: tail fiber domain-containing protein [Candidatus Saccharimonadales bacterium]
MSFAGQLSVARGGTGAASFTSNGIVYGNGSGALQVTAAGTGGQLLVAGVGGVPGFATLSGDATLGAAGALTLADTAVSPSTYGDATHVGQFTVDSKGRITSASAVVITGAAPTGAAGGDLAGNFPNPTVAKLQSTTLTLSSISSGQILQYNGSAIVNQTVTGDVSINGSGTTTIGAGAVTGTKIANNTITNANLASGSYGNITAVGTLTGLGVTGAANFSGSQLTNSGSTLLTATALGNFATGGSIGSAATTVDVSTTFSIAQTTAGQTLTMPVPTTSTAGRLLVINNVGTTSFVMGGNTISAGATSTFEWNGSAWVPTDAVIAGTGLTQSGNVLNSAAATSVVNDTNLQGSISGNALTLSFAGQLSVARGGTGAASFTSNGIVYGNGSGALQVTAAGTGGQVLIANAGGTPTFATFSGDVSVGNTGITTIAAGAVTGTKIANNTITNANLASGSFGNITGLGTLGSLTVSGTTTLSGLNTTGVVHTNASGVLSTGAVVLGTDTSGAYVTSVGAGTGTTIGGTGSAPTVSVNYGATSTTAVRGDTTFTCPSGTGNLSGTGNTITLGSGGTCTALTVINNPSFSGLITGSSNTTGLSLNGTPAASATSSLFQLGSVIAGGNASANGGTYFGLNTPVSGAGSAADFLNFQANSVSKFLVTNTGAVTATSFSGNGSALTSLNGSNISSGTVGNSFLTGSGALTVTAGTGLSGGGSVALGGTTTLNLANTTATVGSFGSASSVATFTVDQQGRLTASGSTAIAIPTSAITSGNYVATLGSLTGLTTSGNTGTGSTPTLSVTYGSGANTAAQGNTSTGFTGGGNLTGTITATAGGGVSANTLDVKANPSFTGLITANANTTGLAVTGTPAASATSSLIQVGSAIAGGNAAANGGTYFGLNTPVSGAGSAADFLNFQANGVSKFSVTNSGALTTAGLITSVGHNAGTGQITGTGGINVSGGNTFGGATTLSSLTTGILHAGAAGAITSSAVTNAELANSSITITSGNNISAGASVALGGTLSIATVNNPSFTTSVTTPLVTNAGALTVSTTGANDLTLASGSNIIVISATTLKSGNLTHDLNGAGANVLAITNSGTGTADLNLAKGGLQIAGTTVLTSGKALQNIAGLTVTSAGASITGGFNNNSGGITLAGAISDATTIAANNTLTLSGTGATELAITGAPAAVGTSSLVQFGAAAITGGSGNGTYLGLNTSSATTADLINLQNNGASKFKITSAGAVTAASTINATTNFQVGGTDGATLAICTASQYIGTAKLTGGIITSGVCTNDATGISDIRLKTDIQVLEPAALDKIKNVGTYSFFYKCDDPDYADLHLDCNLQQGVIAQELMQIFPDLVNQRSDGIYQVNYRGLSVYTLDAVTELAHFIDSKGNATFASVTSNGVNLNDAIDGLQMDINDLKTRVTALETNQSSGSGLKDYDGNPVDFTNLSVGNQVVNLDLIVNGAMIVNGNATFAQAARFIGDATFDGNITANGSLTLSNNSAGYAIIHTGQSIVSVKFSKPYATAPIITVSLGNGQFATYSYTNVTATGFDIIMPTTSAQDYQFSWTATAVTNPFTTDQPVLTP